MKKLLCLVLSMLILFSVFSVPGLITPFASAAVTESDNPGEEPESPVISFFKQIYDYFVSLFNRIKAVIQVRRERVRNTMNQNAIHMLKSVTDTIGDSFIITTDDGKVMVIDGGHRSETEYFVEYLKSVTGSRRPHIDAWFLSHPHDDHCEVFLEVVEKHSEVSFGTVYANFPDDPGFYDGYDEWAVYIVKEYNRLLPSFKDKAKALSEGDVFNIGSAKFTVFYTFNPEWKSCNEASTIMRMDLAGTSVMFNGDAEKNAGNYVVEKYGETGLLECDYCKMSHHGQGGVDKNFYEAVSPEVCIWPTPTWVYENTNGNLTTFETRAWVEELGVKKEYKSFEGSAVIGMKPRIVTTTDVFEVGYDAAKAVDRLAALGYDGIDMGFDYWVFDGSPFLADDYLDWARGLKAHADEAGIAYTHAHAPGEADSDLVDRSIEAAAALGAKYLVVHPVYRDSSGNTITSKTVFIQTNAKAIKKWLAKAEECGVTLLSENILWGSSSDPRVIADLVKEVNSDWFGWCFDVGHAYCCGYGPDIIEKCSVTPVSVHIQDNDGSGDGHLIPGDGTIDFDLFVKALKNTGYLGDCVMEAHHQSLEAPDEERDEILSRLLEKSEKIRDDMR